jgi:hypothetical protein
MDWLERMATRPDAGSEPERSGGPEPGAPAQAAYSEVYVRETPEEKRARIERQRPEREAALAKIRALCGKFTMPGTGDGTPRREVKRLQDPGQADRVKRQIEELRRRGEYDGSGGGA